MLGDPLARPLFFDKNLKIAQGRFLARLTPELVSAWNKLYSQLSGGKPLPNIDGITTETTPPPPPPPVIPEVLSPLMFLTATEQPDTRNIILYGPPGTGKTWLTNHFATYFLLHYNVSPEKADQYWQVINSNPVLAQSLRDEVRNQAASTATGRNYMKFVTFHQSYAYEEFVEGLKPLPPADATSIVQYAVVPGAFRRICEETQHDPTHRYLLVIDEINRANIAKVFGELITLIEDDKRQGHQNALNLRLPYSGASFGVPSNLFIVGTMNTADRSIALLDLALRRRFTSLPLYPQYSMLGSVEGVNFRTLIETLNTTISFLLDPDHQIGHSYFLNIDSVQRLRFVWYNRVIPLLQEYFYNDGDRLQVVLGHDFLEKLSTPPKLADLVPDRYRSRHFANDADFLLALSKLAGTTAPSQPARDEEDEQEP